MAKGRGKVSESVERGGSCCQDKEEGDGWQDEGGTGKEKGRKGSQDGQEGFCPAGRETKWKSKKGKMKKTSRRRRIVGVCCWLVSQPCSLLAVVTTLSGTVTGTGSPFPAFRFYYKVASPGISGINYTLQRLINRDLAILQRTVATLAPWGWRSSRRRVNRSFVFPTRPPSSVDTCSQPSGGVMGSLDGDDDVTAVADKILQAFERYDHCVRRGRVLMTMCSTPYDRRLLVAIAG